MITAQNLVPNGDFEQYWHCPTDISQFDSTKYWFNPSTIGTPDYYNQCNDSTAGVPNNELGFQNANSGLGYAGLYLWIAGTINYREYIEVPLNSTLVANSCYEFKMYINLADRCKDDTYDIGVYFSDTIISNVNDDMSLPYIPQINNINGNLPDTLNWTLVRGYYTANGSEKYLMIGNFKNNVSTDTTQLYNSTVMDPLVYVYIDDVSLTPVSSTPCTNQGITNYNYPQITIFPNPITTQLTININNNEPTELTLYDVTSRKILQQTFVASATINTESLAEGIYLYQLKTSKGIIKEGKVVK